MEQERGDVTGMGQAVVCMLGGEFVVGCGFWWVLFSCRSSASHLDFHLLSLQSSWDLPSA